MKKIIVIIGSILLILPLISLNAYAKSATHPQITQFIDNYRTIYKTDKRAWEKYVWSGEYIYGYDGSPSAIFLDDNTEDFCGSSNKIMKINWHSLPEDELDSKCGFVIHTEDYIEYYGYSLQLNERNVCTTDEIKAGLGVESPEKIVLVSILCASDVMSTKVDSVEFYDCAKGWNTIDGEKYYVKSDGTLATSSCTINGIRYKFGKNGVCEGKYTGWTKNSKGRRYWKDGVLQKNTEVTTKSGKTYTIDRNGYAKVKE